MSTTPASAYVLHLDDEANVLELVGLAVQTLGRQSRGARSLPAALDIVRTNGQPALIICDLHLTDGDGLAAIKALRDACPDAPVMLLTGAVHNLSRSPNYGGLVDAFVAKPCTLAELLDTVERLLAA